MPTKIEWTHLLGTIGESWNPVTGCTKVSEGCRNCYAERMARRLAGRYGYPEAPHHFDVTLHPDRLEQPLRWQKPRTIFMCSMSDLFHEDIPFEFVDCVFFTIREAPQHIFQILTKRPTRMLEWVRRVESVPQADFRIAFPNVWLGVTIEKPEYIYRADYLRETPAAVRFISFEPLLASFADYPGALDGIDWAIVGGESGPGARPMHPDWTRSLRDQCRAAGVPFFLKQRGEFLTIPEAADAGVKLSAVDVMNTNTVGHGFVHVGKSRAGRLLDGREWNEFPQPQRAREPAGGE